MSDDWLGEFLQRDDIDSMSFGDLNEGIIRAHDQYEDSTQDNQGTGLSDSYIGDSGSIDSGDGFWNDIVDAASEVVDFVDGVANSMADWFSESQSDTTHGRDSAFDSSSDPAGDWQESRGETAEPQAATDQSETAAQLSFDGEELGSSASAPDSYPEGQNYQDMNVGDVSASSIAAAAAAVADSSGSDESPEDYSDMVRNAERIAEISDQTSTNLTRFNI